MLLILITIVFILYLKYKPVIEWIEDSEMLICHYNFKTTRKYFILWRN